MKINGFRTDDLYENTGWIVARYWDDEEGAWFWGLYNTRERAQEVADEVNGIIVSVESVLEG
ncbi:MAG: hypothetical protein IJ150_09720 [Bacteroidales bacterium]|nr:hypothetical protein [Bacteroidales bacterium]